MKVKKKEVYEAVEVKEKGLVKLTTIRGNVVIYAEPGDYIVTLEAQHQQLFSDGDFHRVFEIVEN